MRIIDNRLTFGHKITPRIWEDNSGYLICYDCILARTGSYDYLESEIMQGGDPNKIVKVYRTPEEVFSPEAIASFENKPFCNEHPQDDVTPENYKDLMVGTIRNIRRGTGNLENCLVGDVIVFDPEVQELIKSGEKRELSLGYNTDIIQDQSGRYVMTNIRGNHLALVDSGRAGCATIRDSAKSLNKLGGQNGMKNIRNGKKFKYKMLDEDVYEVVDAEPEEELDVIEDDDISTEETPAPVTEEPVHDDDDDKMSQVLDMLTKICEHLGIGADEAEPVVDEDVPEEVEEEIVTDEDIPMEEDTPVEDEDDTFEVEEIEDDDEELEPIEENKAMDADACLPKMDEGMKKDAAPKKKSGSVKAYSKFATVKDSAPVVTAEDVQKSFQDRYNRAAKN